MRLLRISEKFPKGIPVACFLLLAVSAILVTRLLFVHYTRGWEQFPDVRIYQAVGKTVLIGINPYNADKPELRRQLRLETRTAPDDFVTASQKKWDFYLSANPPGSTALYAAFEKIAHGSRLIWRQLFILGDIAILFGMVSLISTLPGGMADIRRQVGVFCLSVAYPFLSMYIPFLSQDKQIQTALMLFAAAALLAADRKSVVQAFFQGMLLSVSVLFKIFGIILLPLWFSKMRHQKLNHILWSIFGGCIPVILAAVAFGAGPITSLANRGANSGFGYPNSASPWRLLLPQMSIDVIVAIKIAIILSCCALLVVLLRKGKIDMLNFCAGMGVVLDCLWFQNGSMDRLNILIMFAMASIVTLSTNRFVLLASIATAVSGICFVVKFPEGGSDQILDAQTASCILLAYFATLLSFWVFPETKPSHFGQLRALSLTS